MAIDLSALKPTKIPKPPRTLVYGPEGIGKSEFWSKAPNPVFIQTEEGTNQLKVVRLPEENEAESYDEVMGYIKELYEQEHDFQTCVIDSADWLEHLCWKHVCKENDKANIEEFGYGKGYVLAADAFRKILDGLQLLRLKKKMVIGFTAHSQVKRFDDPTTEPYDRYKLKMHDRTASVLSEWVDVIGFASSRTIVQAEDVGFEKTARRGVSTGQRLLWTQECPAFVAKNRYSLPESIPLEWAAFSDCVAQSLNDNKEE